MSDDVKNIYKILVDATLWRFQNIGRGDFPSPKEKQAAQIRLQRLFRLAGRSFTNCNLRLNAGRALDRARTYCRSHSPAIERCAGGSFWQRRTRSIEHSKSKMSENNQTQSKRGGARKGAGRKAGSATQKTREIADKAAAAGVTPLEVMLEAMNSFRESGDLEKAAGFAKDAAPYIHPKLAAIEHTGKDGGAIDHSLTVQFVEKKA